MRYRSLTHRGCDARFAGSPDYVRVAASTEQAAATVQEFTPASFKAKAAYLC